MFIPADVLDRLTEMKARLASNTAGIVVVTSPQGKPLYILAEPGDKPVPIALLMTDHAVELLLSRGRSVSAPSQPESPPERPIQPEEAGPFTRPAWEIPIQYDDDEA